MTPTRQVARPACVTPFGAIAAALVAVWAILGLKPQHRTGAQAFWFFIQFLADSTWQRTGAICRCARHFAFGNNSWDCTSNGQGKSYQLRVHEALIHAPGAEAWTSPRFPQKACAATLPRIEAI